LTEGSDKYQEKKVKNIDYGYLRISLKERGTKIRLQRGEQKKK